ncbi:hypothetical protein [Teredinibacter turnerae]|uniref:hypothetical protein n=1 Tax=Teredinibacter turnerae TaxID=2426 RepID=UPI00048B5363|nr:hypothetical protein [Teredinibacter turnerae]
MINAALARASVVIGCVVLTLTGCSTGGRENGGTVTGTPYTFAPETATITVGKLKGAVAAGSTVSWFNAPLAEARELGPVDSIKSNGDFRPDAYLKQQVQRAFEAKGVRFAREAGSTRYQLLVAAGTGEHLTDELHEVFRIYPGMGAVGLKNGAVMVAVLDSVRNIAIWRGAVEGALLQGISSAEHSQRVDNAIDSLMARIQL